MVTALLEAGADAKAADNDGITALDIGGCALSLSSTLPSRPSPPPNSLVPSLRTSHQTYSPQPRGWATPRWYSCSDLTQTRATELIWPRRPPPAPSAATPGRQTSMEGR